MRNESVDHGEKDPVMSEKTHVLIVDDEEEVRKTLFRGLSAVGFSCEEAVDGRAGLEILRQRDFDVALVDIEMPRMNGLELIKTLREENVLAVPVILSSHDRVSNVVEAMRLGAFDFIDKPASPETILNAVERAASHAALSRRAREMIRIAGKWEAAFHDESERRTLQEALIDGIEKEQRRIGQDLHDDLLQQISGISFLVEALKTSYPRRSLI